MQPFARVPGRYATTERREEIETLVANRRRATRIANLGVFTGYRIGLDIGNGNVGWCILFERGAVPYFLTADHIAEHNRNLPADARRTQLPDLSLFVPLGTHKFTARNPDGVSLSKVRATERAKRKTLDWRKYRRWHLLQVLRKAGLLPKDGEEIGGLAKVKADKLRVLLLEPGGATHPHDLGRAIYNALKRRGWMKVVGRVGTDEDSGFGHRSTERYRAALEVTGCRTVGEFLDRCQSEYLTDNKKLIRKRHKPLEWQKQHSKERKKEGEPAKSYELFPFLTPTSTLLLEEVAKLREAQQQTVPISDAIWAEILEKAEFRRALKAREPGPCQYFKETDLRCVRALPSFQEFRMLEQLSQVRTAKGEKLDNETFRRAIEIVRGSERTPIRVFEEALGIGRLHVGKDESRTLRGMETDVALSEVLGEHWSGIANVEERDRWVMRFLRRHEPTREVDLPYVATWEQKDEDALRADCETAFGVGSLERIDADAVKKLDDVFASISARAARIFADGYRQRFEHDAIVASLDLPEPVTELFERLPYYGRVMPERCVPARSFAPVERTSAEEREYGRVTNPDVHVVLNRVRKVVNAIIDMMGGILPTTCIVEIARDALSEEEAARRTVQMRERERLRKAIEKEIQLVVTGLDRRMPTGPRLDRIVDRFVAAHRQGWRDYDGTEIPRSHLVDGSEYQLDHVSPAAFGKFQQSNLFVTRLNRQKGRKLPWEAFPQHRDCLLAFATVGAEARLKGLEAMLRKGSFPAKKRKALEEKVEVAKTELDELARRGGANAPLLAHLRRARDYPLDRMVESGVEEVEIKALRKGWKPGDQAALFRRMAAERRAERKETDQEARDVANIGWSTKLARQYFVHLGANCASVKPWAIHALRCMFNINKCRADLRNHAIDAFLAAHFEDRVMNPAFSRLRGQGYESLYDPRFLELALELISESEGVYEAIGRNLSRLKDCIGTIATAHRPDNQWNPGDAPGGSFGELGGQNIYSFHPDKATLTDLNKVVSAARHKGERVAELGKAEVLAVVNKEGANDPKEIRLQNKLKKKIKLRYRDRKGDEPKETPLAFATTKPIKQQPGAYVASEGKFAIAAPYSNAARQVISIADFSSAKPEERSRHFAKGRPIYRAGDIVVLDREAFVITGLLGDGRLICYRVDDALRTEGRKSRPPVPADQNETPPERVKSDVLGGRLHRRRKTAGDLQPVPYPLFGE